MLFKGIFEMQCVIFTYIFGEEVVNNKGEFYGLLSVAPKFVSVQGLVVSLFWKELSVFHDACV